MNTKANRNSFQALVKANSVTDSSAGAASGRVICQKASSRLAPSIIAASSSSTGIERK